MNIGFLTFTFHGGSGSSIYARSFLKYLDKNKKIDRVTVLTIGPNKPIRFSDKSKIIDVHCTLPSYLKRYEFGAKIIKLIDSLREEEVELVHAEHSFEGVSASMYKRKYGVPFVYVREVVSKFLPSFYSRYILFNIEKYLVEHLNYDILVSWSKYMVDEFFSKWNINQSKIRVIPGGVDTERFNPFSKVKNIREKYGIDDDDFLLLSVKVLTSSNLLGLINAIKAFKIFVKDKQDAKYLIIGGGPRKKVLENLVHKLNLDKKVILAGAIKNEELPNYYRSSDVTVHFFTYDASISVSMMESLACGIPIVTTNVGEVPNIIDRKVGVLVKENCEEMSKGLEYLYDNVKVRKMMSKNAWKLTKTKFDMRVIVNKYVQLYEELLS